MQPVIIGVRKKITKEKKDLPKINGFMYKPIQNKLQFPYEGPIVLITNIKDKLLPGERVILGPYCDCEKCQKENKVPGESQVTQATENRGTITSQPEAIKRNQIFTSTPNEGKIKSANSKTNPVNIKDNIKKLNDSKNIQSNEPLEFSAMDTDSDWDKRQELLTRLSKELEKQVDMELKQNKQKITHIKDDQQESEFSETDAHGFKLPKSVPKSKKKGKRLLNEEKSKAKDVKRTRQASTNSEKDVIPSPQVERVKASGKRRTLYSPSTSTFYEQSLFRDLGE